MKKTILKAIIIISVITLIAVGAYFLLVALGLDNFETLKAVANDGWWGIIIFFFLQIFQVVFIPVGTLLFTGPLVILFGGTKAFLISWTGIVVGSIILFLIAKYSGNKILKWIVGEKNAIRYAEIVSRGKFLLPIILMIPIFPDDVICAAAGVARMNTFYFCMVIIITRAIDNACTCFIGAELIKSTTGIIVLCIFVLIMIVLSYFLAKYQIQIENWIVDKLTTKKKLEVYYSNDTKIIIEKEKKIYIVVKYVKEDNIYVKKYSSEKFTSIQDARKKADELISIEKKCNSSACVDDNLIKKVSQ